MDTEFKEEMHEFKNEMYEFRDNVNKEFNSIHNEMNAMHNEMNDMHNEMNAMHNEINDMRSEMNTMHNELNDMHRILILIEDDLHNKIPALFDAFSLTQDQNIAFDKRITTLENITEHHSFKIAALESASNASNLNS